jgi:hypothetical protein
VYLSKNGPSFQDFKNAYAASQGQSYANNSGKQIKRNKKKSESK